VSGSIVLCCDEAAEVDARNVVVVAVVAVGDGSITKEEAKRAWDVDAAISRTNFEIALLVMVVVFLWL